jgi:hypothetical protein
MNSIVCCVDFDDFLRITLPKNIHHFDRTVVVTAPHDIYTAEVCAQHGADCFITDAFYKDGACFNKGAAMEEGFDVLGREGWICIWDADIVMPESMDLSNLREDCLYGVPRRILDDPHAYHPEIAWLEARMTTGHEFQGFFQLFNASSLGLIKPWYGTTWKHAGGCDNDFLANWPDKRRVILPFEVLHLGPAWENWHGRVSPRVDTGEVMPQSEMRSKLQREMFEEQRRMDILPPIEKMG